MKTPMHWEAINEEQQTDRRREADEHIIVKNQSIKVWLNDHEHVQKKQS